jgi:hypothetical protein
MQDIPLTDGTACDDGNAVTVNDTCTQGFCGGVDPCEGVVCSPLGACFEAGTCRGGVCTTPLKLDFSACNDGDAETYFDRCFGGVCAPELACNLSSCVAWSKLQGMVETTRFGLRRTLAGTGWNASAVSLQGLVAEDFRAGVQFRPAQTDANLAVGLGTASVTNNFEEIAFAVFVATGGSMFVYESGVFRAVGGRYRANDTMAVWVNRNNRVEYVLNGVVVFRSAASPTYPLHVDAAFNSADAAAEGFQWVSKQDAYCLGKACAPATDCLTASVCVLGECTAQVPQPEKASCTLNDPTLHQFGCDGRGPFPCAGCRAGGCSVG